MTICSETRQLKDTVLQLKAASGITDQTNYGNDCSFIGSDIEASSNAVDGFVFNGTDDRMTTLTSFAVPIERTFSCWFYITPGSAALNRRFFQQVLGAWSVNITNLGAISASYGATTVTTSTVPSEGVWHHVVVLHDGTDLLIYFNNTLISTTTITGAVHTQFIRIGSINGASQLWDGSMKDLLFIDRAITVTEIRLLYNATARPAITGEVLKLQPATGLVDQSVAGQANSTYVGDAAVVGRRYVFDGTGDYMSVPASLSTITNGGAFSVALWILNPSDTAADYFGDFEASPWPFLIRQSTANIQVYINLVRVINYNSAVTSSWKHICVTHDGVDLTLWVNGVEATRTAYTTFPSVAGNGIRMGLTTGSAGSLDGSLDDIRIYSTALTAAQVLTLYEGVPGYEPPLPIRQMPDTVLHLEAATGEIDRSFHANDGTFTGTDIAANSTDTEFVFNGTDDYLDFNTSPLQNVSAFSVSFWIYATGNGNWLGRWATPGTSKGILFRNAPTLDMFVRDAADTIEPTATHTLPINGWHHVVGIGDGANITLYVDGVAGTPVAMTGPYFPVNSDTWALGYMNSSFGASSLDDIRVISRTLSAGEISLLYNKGVPNYRPFALLGGEVLALEMSRHDVGVLDGTVLQLDGKTGVTDQSPAGNDGVMSGGMGVTDGKFVFDGVDDYIDCGDVQAMSNAVALTILFRIKQTTLDVFDRWIYREVSGGNAVKVYSFSDGKLYLEIRNGTGVATIDYSTVMTAGQWHTVAIVYDGGGAADADRLKLYVDGIATTLVFSTAIPATLGDLSTANMLVGGDGSDALLGSLDDIRILNRALTAAEVTTLYNNDIKDESGSGNDGTLTNGAYVGESNEIVLDGVNDYVDAGTVTIADDVPWSFHVWLYLTVEKDLHGIYGNQFSASNFTRFMIGDISGTKDVILYNDAGDSTVWQSVAYPIGSWFCLTLVADGTNAANMELFLDGTSLGTKTFADSSQVIQKLGSIGQTSGSYMLDGSIKDPRIFNRALTPAEILALASEAEFQVPNTKGSVLSIVPSYDDFGNGLVNAIDFSGNGNVGTLTNMDPATDWVDDVDEGGTRALDITDSDDYVVPLNIITIADDAAWTISLWFNLSTAPSVSGLWGHLFTTGGYTRCFLTASTLVVYNDANAVATWSGLSWSTDVWQIATIVCNGTDSSNLELYLNGVSQGAKTLADSSQTISVLYNYRASSGSVRGIIDDTYIFPRALSLDEIKALASTRNYFDCPIITANLFGDAVKMLMGQTH